MKLSANGQSGKNDMAIFSTDPCIGYSFILSINDHDDLVVVVLFTVIVGWEELSSVAWSTGAQLIIFFCFRLSVVLFDRPGISIRHTAHCVCRVLVSASA